MAALTWREVAAPQFSGANDAFRTATALQTNALSGLGDAIKQFQKERTAGLDSQLLARAMQIQDPTEFRKSLTTGELLQGRDPSQIDPKTLEQVDARLSRLLQQRATEQSIASSKLGDVAKQQDIDQNSYTFDRTKRDDQISDAARTQLAAALGNTGAIGSLDLDAQQKIAGTLSSLATAALGRASAQRDIRQKDFNFSTGVRDDSAKQEALAEALRIQDISGTSDDYRLNQGLTQYSSPQAQYFAQKMLEQNIGQPLFAPVDAASPGSGGRSGSGGGGQSGGQDGTPPVTGEAGAALLALQRTTAQNNAVGVTPDILKNLSNTSTPLEVVKAFSEGVPAAEVEADNVLKLITEARAKYPDLSPADVGAAIARSTTSNFFGSTRFADGIGVDDKAFEANLRSIASGDADKLALANQNVEKAISDISRKQQNLTEAKQQLGALVARSQSQPNIDTYEAEARVLRLQQALDDALKEQRENPARNPNYLTPPPANKPNRGRANNRPDRNNQ